MTSSQQQQKAPSYKDMEIMKTNLLIDQIKETIEEENLDKYIHTIEELIEEDYNSIDIAAALLKFAKE